MSEEKGNPSAFQGGRFGFVGYGSGYRNYLKPEGVKKGSPRCKEDYFPT